jgi:hypothetical protein
MYVNKLTGAILNEEDYKNRLMMLWKSKWDYNLGDVVKQYKKEKKTFKDYVEYMENNYIDTEYEIRKARNIDWI